jgi:putative phosphoserine phosphatase/1-acylglycerol-3-phosphate O-acyltransferase
MSTTGSGAAFFDVDRTLLPGISAEMLLVRAMLRRKLPGRFRLLPYLIEAIRLLPKGPTIMRKANKAFLAGASPDQVRAWGERLFVDAIAPRLADDPGRSWVARERARGRAIVLLTGMPDLLLAPFVRHFAADLGVGTPLDLDTRGRLTGTHTGLHPYGQAKLTIARSLCERHGWEARACSAYGDHESDAALLEWVGEAFAVDPDDGLRSIAHARAWTILDRTRG